MRLRRAARFFPPILLALLTIVAPGPSRAQDLDVRLSLESQTPWSTPQDPILRVDVRATNEGTETLDELALGILLGAPVRSRTDFESMLAEGPPFASFAQTFPAGGDLAPGESRVLTLSVDLSVAVTQEDSVVEVAALTLFSRNAPIAMIPTPVIYLVRPPQVPVPFTWWVELQGKPLLDPQGRLAPNADELDPAGRTVAEVDALARLAGRNGTRPFTLVVEPALLEQLTRMADGYERADGSAVAEGTGGAAAAADTLAGLRDVAASDAAEIVGLPFAAPDLSAMLGEGLGADLDRQYEVGSTWMTRALDTAGTTSVARPTGRVFDAAALAYLESRGATAILGRHDSVERPIQPNEFAPPATATLAGNLGSTVPLILPDPGTTALFNRLELRRDPVRLAQAVVGELAVIWREQPVPPDPIVRGLALALSSTLPAGVWRPLTTRLDAAPFLRPVHAQELTDVVEPHGAPAELTARSARGFTPAYVTAIREARDAVDALASMLTVEGPIPARLERDLLYAESTLFVGDEENGRRWIDHVRSFTGAIFARAAPVAGQGFTLTSGSGSLPIRMGDPGDTPLRLIVEAQSAWFRFPDGARRQLVLDRPEQAVTLHVDATSAGRRTIRVIIRAPSGMAIAQRDVIVRSTEANTIALIITAAAALGLVALWSRRLFRRTRS